MSNLLKPILLSQLVEDSASEKRVAGKTPAAERRLVLLESFARYSDEAEGFVLTKQRKGPRQELGSRIGNMRRGHSTHYRRVLLDKTLCWEHHLVWLWFTGEFVPAGLEIDHINGDGNNNQIDNLRAATKSINQRNSRKRKDNTSGESNVHLCQSGWQLKVCLEGKQQYFGIFQTLEEAVAKRDEIFASGFGYTKRHGK